MTARVRVPVGAEAGWLALDEARRLPRNPKRHDVGAIASSVARFGVLEIPVINRRTGRLLAGHGRIDALQAMKAQGRRAPRGIRVGPAGRWLVFVRWVDLPEREEEAAALALNRTHDLGGGYDDQVLVQILADLAAGGDGALAGTGYDADDVDALLRGQLAEAERTRAVLPPEEPAAGPAEACQARWQVQPGDVWEIPGAHAVHRVVCGDATDPATWTALFRPGTPRAACVFTDPPYGVDYQPERKGPVAGDALRGDAYTRRHSSASRGRAVARRDVEVRRLVAEAGHSGIRSSALVQPLTTFGLSGSL